MLDPERLVRQRLGLARPEPLLVVDREIEQDVLVDQGRAERLGLDRPEHGQHLAARVSHMQSSPRCAPASTYMQRPIHRRIVEHQSSVNVIPTRRHRPAWDPPRRGLGTRISDV